MRLHSTALFSSLVLMATAVAPAGPPRRGDLRPLSAGPAAEVDSPGSSKSKANEPGERQLFYYNGEQKVFLLETDRAVAKLNPGESAPEGSVDRETQDRDDPIAGVAPALERSGLLVVRTRGPRSLNLRPADSPPGAFRYVLPIVVEDLVASDPSPIDAKADGPPQRAARDAETSPIVMRPYISARFSEEVTGPDPGQARGRVDAYLADVAKGGPSPALRVVAAVPEIPGAFTLELVEGPINSVRLIEAANALYEAGHAKGKVRFAKPDFIRTKRSQQINDPRYPNQWHLNNTGQGGGQVDSDVDAPEAWEISRGDPSIRLAIIDDCVERDHPDLAGNFRVGRYYDGTTDPPSTSNDPSPRTSEDRHGTACAGVAVGVANEIGVRGVAPDCGLIGVHFWYGTDLQAAQAFAFCNDPDGNGSCSDGAAVISCSWSINGTVPIEIIDAVDDVVRDGRVVAGKARGLVVLFAAANDGIEIRRRHQLGTLESVICVGAINWRDDHALYSNFGPELDVVAPSDDDVRGALRIDTTDNTDAQPKRPGRTYSGYMSGDYTGIGEGGFGGTSSATPLAAGVCALILSANPDLTATQVRAILEHTTDPVRGTNRVAAYDPTTNHDPYYGYGCVNARRAVRIARDSRSNPEIVWPDHVANLSVARADSTDTLSWEIPPDDAEGILVVEGSRPINWHPRDGDSYSVGDAVGDGSARVISTDLREALEIPGGAAGHQYAVFARSAGDRYSWGQVAQAPASGGGRGPIARADARPQDGRMSQRPATPDPEQAAGRLEALLREARELRRQLEGNPPGQPAEGGSGRTRADSGRPDPDAPRDTPSRPDPDAPRDTPSRPDPDAPRDPVVIGTPASGGVAEILRRMEDLRRQVQDLRQYIEDVLGPGSGPGSGSGATPADPQGISKRLEDLRDRSRSFLRQLGEGEETGGMTPQDSEGLTRTLEELRQQARSLRGMLEGPAPAGDGSSTGGGNPPGPAGPTGSEGGATESDDDLMRRIEALRREARELSGKLESAGPR